MNVEGMEGEYEPSLMWKAIFLCMSSSLVSQPPLPFAKLHIVWYSQMVGDKARWWTLLQRFNQSSCGNGDWLAVALSTVVRSKLVPYLRKAAELFRGLQSMEEDFVSPSPRGAPHILPTHVACWNEQPKFYSCILITLFLYHWTKTQNNTPNLYGGHNHI